jgi:hypothetical protein
MNMNTQTIQATVNSRLLQKASRLFTGTKEGRIIEILQNARRAGATEVRITNEDGLVIVRDNGRGIDDFRKLLDLGSSGWDEDVEASEDPAGVGLFCLAPRETTIRSNGKSVTIANDGWTGDAVEIEDNREPVSGTMLQFADSPWTLEAVAVNAVFSGLHVFVDGAECPTLSFVTDASANCPELGCRIEVCRNDQMGEWHNKARRGPSYTNNAMVNFHGQVVSFDYHPVSEQNLRYLVDLTGQPTGIRLMLPARTQLVENEAFATLKAAMELEAYRFIERCGKHALPYKEYLRAQALGISLPEAEPTYSIGLLNTGDSPEPVEVCMPKDFPLARCYRFADLRGSRISMRQRSSAGGWATAEPFVPVDIRSPYDGYSWANLATIESVEVTLGKELHRDWLWSGEIACVDSMRIAVRTSDGRTFESDVPMAIQAPSSEKSWADATVYVTSKAQSQLGACEIWYHLGGWNEDGDTYETQEHAFSEDIERFWAALVGPDEYLRQNIMKVLFDIRRKWKHILITSDGAVDIQFKSGRHKRLQPPLAK